MTMLILIKISIFIFVILKALNHSNLYPHPVNYIKAIRKVVGREVTT